MRQIIDASTKLVVMSEKGHELLRSVHDVPAHKIEVIPHGIPDFPFLETHHAKAKFGFSGKTVILTFGLLSPSKGIETMIDAMPASSNPARTPSMWSSVRPIPTSCGIRARPIAKA